MTNHFKPTLRMRWRGHIHASGVLVPCGGAVNLHPLRDTARMLRLQKD